MSVLKLTVIADPSKFRAGMSQIKKDLYSLRKTTQSVGNSMNKALGFVGLTTGIGQLNRVLRESAHAAVEDSKTKDLLALSLRNTLGATKQTTDAAEKWIKKTMLATAVLDEKLRPALSQAVAATGSLSKGQELTNVALDVAAFTGKDLVVVTKALARAQNGQMGGLQKLIPGLKAGTNRMDQLKQKTDGMAIAAANADPFNRLLVIMDDIKETVGNALLPYIQELAAYLASDIGQKSIEQIVNLFVEFAKAVGKAIGWLVQNAKLVKDLAGLLVILKLQFTLLTGAIRVYDTWTKLATGSTLLLKAALGGIALTGLTVAIYAMGEAWNFAREQQKSYEYLNRKKSNVNVGDSTIVATGRIWLPKALKTLQNDGKNGAAVIKKSVKKVSDAGTDTLNDAADKIKKAAERFRDSIGLAFGTRGTDETSIFNVDIVINKLKRMVNAAKGFKENIAKLVKAGAGQDVVQELLGMGPAQGNIVAKGLLASGKLSEYLGLRGSLYNTGASVGTLANNVGDSNYTINLNKSNVSAEDIIRTIRAYEKKTRRKYFAN